MNLPFAFSFSAVFREIFSFILSIVMTLSGFGSATPEDYTPLDSSNLQAQFSVISDTHIEFNPAEEGVIRFESLRKGLLDMGRSAVPNDAVILAGDNTENGQLPEYITLFSYLRRFNQTNLLMAMGNHETFGLNHEHNYAKALSRFLSYYNRHTGKSIDKSYYYEVIKGYYFIVLGTEAVINSSEAYISQEQIEWLDGILANSGENPVFIINHQPFMGTHGTTSQGESMGEQSDAVYNTVSQYKNVFYFSGHIHKDLNMEYSYERTAQGVNVISLPAFGKSAVPGCGIQVEVYPDTVALRGRNFAAGQWLEEFSVQIPLD